MKKLTLEVTGLTDGLSAFRQAWSSGMAEDGARIGFATPELLGKVLTAKRREDPARYDRKVPWPCGRSHGDWSAT